MVQKQHEVRVQELLDLLVGEFGPAKSYDKLQAFAHHKLQFRETIRYGAKELQHMDHGCYEPMGRYEGVKDW